MSKNRMYICLYCGKKKKIRTSENELPEEICSKRNDGGMHFWINCRKISKERYKEIQASDNPIAEYMYYEAYCYATGGAQKDIQKAILWYQKAAEEGHGKAMVALGEIYRKGNGVPKDIEEAFLWYEKSARVGYVDAMLILGNAYKVGEDVCQDVERAMFWYEKSANAGCIDSMVYCGHVYEVGEGVPQNIEKSMFWYEKSANAGCIDSMVRCGHAYEVGDGVPQDIEKSMFWYEKSANAGCIDSMLHCGNAYKIGDRVLQDLEKSEQWYQKAFDKRDHRGEIGLFSLGCMYEKRNNRTKAMRIYEKLAKANKVSPPSFSLWIGGIFFPFQPPPPIITDVIRQTDENSAYDLARRGYAYEHGMAGVEKDWNKALEWYQKAADAGNLYSMVVLGDVYSKGELQDEEKAFGYFRQAAMIGCGNQN